MTAVSGIKADCICACRYFGACATTLSDASRIPVGVTAAIVLLTPMLHYVVISQVHRSNYCSLLIYTSVTI